MYENTLLSSLYVLLYRIYSTVSPDYFKIRLKVGLTHLLIIPWVGPWGNGHKEAEQEHYCNTDIPWIWSRHLGLWPEGKDGAGIPEKG